MTDAVTERFHSPQSIGREADRRAADVSHPVGVRPIHEVSARTTGTAGGPIKQTTKGGTAAKSGRSEAADVLRKTSTRDINNGQKGRANENGISRAASGRGASTAKANGRIARGRATTTKIGTRRNAIHNERSVGPRQTLAPQAMEDKSKDTRKNSSGNSSRLFSRKHRKAGNVEPPSSTMEPNEMVKSGKAKPTRTPKHRRENGQVSSNDSGSSDSAPGRDGDATISLRSLCRLINGHQRVTKTESERRKPSDISEASAMISDGEARRKARRGTRRIASLKEKSSSSYSDQSGDWDDPAVSSPKTSPTDSPTQPQEGYSRNPRSCVSPVEVAKKRSQSMFRSPSWTDEHGDGNEEASDDRVVNVGDEHENNRGNRRRSGIDLPQATESQSRWPPLIFADDGDDGDANTTRRSSIRSTWTGFVGPWSFRNWPTNGAAAANIDHLTDEALRNYTAATGDKRCVAHVDQHPPTPVTSDISHPVAKAAAAVDLVKRRVSRLVSSENESVDSIDVMGMRAGVEPGQRTGGNDLLAGRGGNSSRAGGSWSDNEACFFGLGG